jgi:hypothetical protein
MPGLVPGIHAFKKFQRCKDLDGRDKPGHDEKHAISCAAHIFG